MNVTISENNIGIVIRGDFNEIKTTPKYLLSKGIITHEEFVNQSDDCVITPSEMKYNLGEINYVGDPTRIQVTSTDISLSGRLIGIVLDILSLSNDARLVSVGINAGVLFTFSNQKDAMIFGQHFGMLNNMSPFMEDPRLRSVVYEDNVKATASSPKVTIRLSSLEAVSTDNPQKNDLSKSDGGIPVCTFDINNHFVVHNYEEAITLIKQAELYHSLFREKYKQVFRTI